MRSVQPPLPGGPSGGEAVPPSEGRPLERQGGSRTIATRDIAIADIPDAAFATDLEYRITHWADSATLLFGYSATAAIGRLFGDLLAFRMRHAADDGEPLAAIRSGRTWRGVGSVRLRGGTERWIELTVKPWVIDNEIVGSVSVSRDVSETVEADMRLSDEKRLASGVLDVAGSLVIVLDPAGTVLRFNATCEQISGFRAEEIVGHPIWDLLVPPDEMAGVEATFAHLRAGQFPNTYEYHWVRRDGARRLISWASTCLTDDGGAVTHVIGTGTDVTEQRRNDDALRGIAVVGQVLASRGPTPASLDAVLETLADHMGYHHLALFIVEGDRLRVGAVRGFAEVPESIAIDQGIVGRVARTGETAWATDVGADSDYFSVDPDIRSEVAVPLRADGRTIGVLDIEATSDAPLTERDVEFAQTVAERVASALQLGREQQALAQRARLLAALTDFARATNAILEPERLEPALMEALTQIFPGDVMTLTTMDRSSGRYYLRATRGIDGSVIGKEVRPGDGPAGRAIQKGSFIGPVTLERDGYWSAVRDVIQVDRLVSVTVPLMRDELVLGAISIGRANLEHAFTDVECEVMALLGAQAALALANAHLHQLVSELAIHDGLTGLYNRRHFDAALDLIFARWRRLGGQNPLSAIMFDLDHFGQFNKKHGHQAGDAVLRSFAGLMRERLRSSDLAARYGGEEFVVILEDCHLADAVRVAEEIRAGLEAYVIVDPLGQQLHARVSAGCAELNPADPTSESLLRAADVGLSMAKRAGRNQVVAA